MSIIPSICTNVYNHEGGTALTEEAFKQNLASVFQRGSSEKWVGMLSGLFVSSRAWLAKKGRKPKRPLTATEVSLRGHAAQVASHLSKAMERFQPREPDEWTIKTFLERTSPESPHRIIQVGCA
ncbi:MAG: hypothetical protein ACH37Z_12240 [Anaerolineae bacterium]